MKGETIDIDGRKVIMLEKPGGMICCKPVVMDLAFHSLDEVIAIIKEEFLKGL